MHIGLAEAAVVLAVFAFTALGLAAIVLGFQSGRRRAEERRPPPG